MVKITFIQERKNGWFHWGKKPYLKHSPPELVEKSISSFRINIKSWLKLFRNFFRMVVHGVPRPEPDHMAFLLDQVKYTLQYPHPEPTTPF